MAKIKLDWFKLDCQMDDKIELIESEFGLTGFAVIVKLFMKIYGGEGYYCEWSDDVALMFARRNGVGVNVVSEIIKAAIKRGIFSAEKYTKFGILTSHGIQSRYFDVVDRRKGVKVKSEYLLLCNTQISSNADITSENDNISKKNDNIFSQKRKEKNRKEEIREEESTQPQLTTAQYNSLVNDYGKEITEKYIAKVKSYCEEKRNGKPYKNTDAVIRKWITEDKPEVPKKSSFDIDEISEFQKNFLINQKGKE